MGLNSYAILYVEDDIGISRLMQIHLNPQKYMLDIAENGYKALDKIQNIVYDAILIDYHLPDINCSSLIEKIRLKNQKAVIIVLTAYKTEQLCAEVLEKGADACIEKNISGAYIKELPSIIEELAAQK